MRRTKNILICGRPGVGKTTLIKKVAEKLGEKAAGFYTEEIRKEKERVGFKIKNLEGKEGILAHIDCKSPYRVGKYKVNLNEFEEISLPSIERGIKEEKIIIIDEIGKMELYSKKFRQVVIQALDSPNNVIATIPAYKNEFLKKIRQRGDVEIYEIMRENREKLWDYLFTHFISIKIS
jgi:nucleoside-triphosphatase